MNKKKKNNNKKPCVGDVSRTSLGWNPETRVGRFHNRAQETKSKGQIGGTDVISASSDLINSMVSFGNSIFTGLSSITNIQQDINNGPSAKGLPPIQGPPPFNPPKL